jgi:UDP-N-acetylglucosamine acyltransferase
MPGSGAVVGADIPGQTIIGNRNVIGNYAVVGVKCQDLKYKVAFLNFHNMHLV